MRFVWRRGQGRQAEGGKEQTFGEAKQRPTRMYGDVI